MMLHDTIHVTHADMARLFALIERTRRDGGVEEENLDRLEEELARSRVVPAAAVPADVVTMNSRVTLRPLDGVGGDISLRLTYPGEVCEAERCVSILAPLGTAILGYRVGDEVTWPMPSGLRRFRVEAVHYQPEAAGDFHL